eukprot:TRINITY_DN36024_c0_g1_i1.p1 TRINITY_DN36024_c0_g1~~TRINITY_DN36024_c0_g1_i1.p1  ORF type:complete len:104 (+),score=8.47 TRINITY_DN36024_c0_g1_i1:28-312(+)
MEKDDGKQSIDRLRDDYMHRPHLGDFVDDVGTWDWSGRKPHLMHKGSLNVAQASVVPPPIDSYKMAQQVYVSGVRGEIQRLRQQSGLRNHARLR